MVRNNSFQSSKPDALLTRSEEAYVGDVTLNKMLHEVAPQFDIILVTGSDNGMAFIILICQFLLLGLIWNSCSACRPHNLEKVERITKTLKETLTKLTVETYEG